MNDEFDPIPAKHADRWGGEDGLCELKDKNGDLVGSIPLKRLYELNPFDFSPWQDGRDVTPQGVQFALKAGRLESTPYSLDKAAFGREPWTTQRHEERIAYLVTNRSRVPINLEFSSADDPDNLSCDDGNHRLAAAFFCDDDMIDVAVGGFVSHTVYKLGAICSDFQKLDYRRAIRLSDLDDDETAGLLKMLEASEYGKISP